MTMPDTRRFHLHLISDSTGETLHALARAALAPFGNAGEVEIHHSVFVRSARDLEGALDEVRAHPGLVWFTAVDPPRRS
jgi:regulator of PEP synthase PpsR (kinase-PPPase family)